MRQKMLLLSCLVLTCTCLLAQSGNIGIGTNSPGAKLDIVSSYEGVLIPRVALDSLGDTITVPSPDTSELLYNTSKIHDINFGFHFWDGAKWQKLVNATESKDGDWYGVGSTEPPNNIFSNQYTHGNVGIGATVPQNELAINGDIAIGNVSTTVWKYLYFTRDVNTTNYASFIRGNQHLMEINATEPGGSISLISNRDILLLPGTYVGVGNPTPITTLDVLGDFKLTDGTEGVGKVLVSDGLGRASWSNDLPNEDSDYIWNHTGPSEQSASFRIDGTGIIGPSPGGLGSARFRISNSSSDFIDYSFTGSGSGQLAFIGGPLGWVLGNETNGKHLFINSNSSSNTDTYIGRLGNDIFIDGATGSVGVGGEYSTTAQMNVIGNIRSSNTASESDYIEMENDGDYANINFRGVDSLHISHDGTANVAFESDGDIRMLDDNAIHMSNNIVFGGRYTPYGVTGGDNSWHVIATVPGLSLDEGDIIKFEAVIHAEFTGGSGLDEFNIRVRNSGLTGNCSGIFNYLPVSVFPPENANNHNNYFVIPYLFIATEANCTGGGTRGFELQIRNLGNDGYEVNNVTFAVTKY